MMSNQISVRQLFCMVVLFELGSAIVVGLGMDAGQDAWIAILLGMFSGLAAVHLYAYLHERSSGKEWTDHIVNVFGPWIGTAIALGYIIYFLYIAGRVLRDFGALLISSSLNLTSPIPVAIVMGFVVLYAYLKGIESFARSGEMVMEIMVLIGIFLALLISFSDIIRPENTLPVLGEGWKPVLSTAYPLTSTFPFGELIAFLMIFPNVRTSTKSGIRTVMVKAVLASGAILTVVIWTDIAVLGAKRASLEHFPLLTVIGRISIGSFIQRMDAFAISILILGVFYKVTVFFYASVQGFTTLMKLNQPQHRQIIAFIFGAGLLWLSFVMSGSYVEHIETGLKKVPLYMHVPMQYGIPLIMAMIIVVKRKRSSKSME
ncbi:hypothetical protein SY83_19395 [Paenibacillus swuensis]|uniref:Uncharacterized protein n=1 Tax=Paenibacillus swuensis TaxID=1178515 RepID=A0A172TMG3_9BACL|nr:GerAB/ArcD/ProY family transporter [Paenibacillus swuensis]ANE48094.1 hypothetical protein SY83_19395 [Paenibacillus swuensis]